MLEIVKLSEKVFEEQVLLKATLPANRNLITLLTSFIELVIDYDSLFPTLSCHNEDDHLRKLTHEVIE